MAVRNNHTLANQDLSYNRTVKVPRCLVEVMGLRLVALIGGGNNIFAITLQHSQSGVLIVGGLKNPGVLA